MNNHRLLCGMLAASLLSCGAVCHGQSVMTLEEIFEVAEAHSAQLAPSLSAETEADKAVDVARANRLPDIGATLSLSHIGDGFTTKRNFSDYQKAPIPHLGTGLGVNVSQPVYAGGAITAGIDLARMKSTAARYATELQRNSIRFELAGYYLDIYKYSNLRTVVESNISAARKVLDEMRARYQQGVVLSNDITRYELLVANLDLQLTKINNVLEILNNNIVTTAGLPQGTVVVPDSTILARALPLAGEGSWQESAQSSSPAIRLARKAVEMSAVGEKLAKSERMPKVGLQAGWTIDGPILVEVPPINRNLSYWWVGVGVSYNLSSLFKSNKTMAQSRAATRVAADRLAAEKERVSMGVRADYVRYLEAYQELETEQKSVELAERNYRTVSTRYNAGMALITDMLDAANSRIDAEQRLVNARINIIYYYYKLLFISGKI